MQRFFLNPENFSGEKISIRDPGVLHQMQLVLRMKSGDQFIALDNSGYEYLCSLENLDKNSASANIIEKRKNIAEPAIFVSLYQALPKKMNLFELVLQKCTEIGISAFVPLITERTERREIKNRERLEKILREAAEQCERGKIPELADIQKFPAALAHAHSQQKFLLHGRGNFPLLSSVIANPESKSGVNSAKQFSYDIFIGPEGGFTESEVHQAEKNDFSIASLGPAVLRTETAGIVAASLITQI